MGFLRRLPALLLVASPVAVAVPAPPAHATQTICVAVVVDFRPLGGDVQTTCAKVADGSTGNQVMSAAGHRLSFRRDGLVCAVDGLPSGGCSSTDSSHYWSYWHRAPGSSTWQYSSQGSGTYRPADDATEGWVWQDGGAEGSNKPADVPYRQICPPEPTASPTRTAATSAPAPAPAPVRRAAVTPQSTSAPPARTAPAATASPTRSPAASAAPSASGSAAPTPSASASGVRTTTTPVATARAEPAAHGGGGFPTGLVVGVLAAVAVGGAAVARARR